MTKWLPWILLLVASELGLAQVPELLYLKLNSTGGTSTANRALPGLPASPTLVGGAGWNSSAPKLGAAAYRSSFSPANNSLDGLQTNTPFTVAGDWTLECWVFRNGTQSFSHVICADDASGFRMSWQDNFPEPGVIKIEGPFPTFYMKGEPTLGNWHHVALVHDAQGRTLLPYFDGVPQELRALTAPLQFVGSAGPGLVLGNSSTSALWVGSIDEFRVWDHARTSAQIQANMNQQLVAQSLDLALTDVQAPSYVPGSFVLGSSAETVTVEVRNLGTNTIAAGSMIQLSYALDGGAPVVETLILAFRL